jgi:hypothetical protein
MPPSRNQISQERKANEIAAEARRNDSENKEMLREILANQEILAHVADLHRAGKTIAIDIMEGGQEVGICFLRMLQSSETPE